MSDFGGLLAVFVLVLANGFFVAAEFSLVAVRRSRVMELVAAKRMNAQALAQALGNLDANLAATQLGITISSLALGWVGEPAIAHLIEAPLGRVAGSFAGISAYTIAVAISFIIITALHIVLGELAPKSLALQRSEGTALWVIRPLALFRWLFHPAITVLNGLGNLVLRLFGLRPGTGEEGALHSASELKLIVAESQDAGLLQRAQEEIVVRTLDIGNRAIGEFMTPRTEVDWIDIADDRDAVRQVVLESRHGELLVGRGSIDEIVGVVAKKDLLGQVLAGRELDPAAAVGAPLLIHEGVPIFKVLELFKQAPVRLAVVVDEYGGLEGIVTQTDLLEALAGDLPDDEGGTPDIVERDDGSLLIDGMAPVNGVLGRLGLSLQPHHTGFHTIAGFVLAELGRLPATGDGFSYDGWSFEVVDMDGRRIDKLLVKRETPDAQMG